MTYHCRLSYSIWALCEVFDICKLVFSTQRISSSFHKGISKYKWVISVEWNPIFLFAPLKFYSQPGIYIGIFENLILND